MGAFEREVGVKRQEPKSVEQIYKEFVRSLFRNDYHALYHYSKFTIDSEKETSSLSSVKYKGNQESSVRVIAESL